MQSNPRLHAKKTRSNLLNLLISLIYAIIFAVPVTILIFGLDSPIFASSGTPASITPIMFIFGFLIIFAPAFSILTFIKTGSQFAYKKILNNENRKNIVNKYC